MMINSFLLPNDSIKHDDFSNTLENFNDINNNNNSIDCNNTMKQDNLSLNDTTLLTTTTTTTVEVKVKTTSRKRKLNIINDNNNKEQTVRKKKKKQYVTKIDDEPLNKNSKTVDQSSVTDESSFGSCEPGTHVVLQGIVWNETDKGVLVVNITWRGKTYVGALLNTTEQNWAPPRYKNDIRPNKQNPNRDHQLTTTTTTPSSHDTTERILRNGKRRGSSITVTPSPTTKTKSFKIPEAPVTIKNEKLSVPLDEDINRNPSGDDETGDNDSSRSVSPITSGTSTTSSSSPPLNQTAIDLSNSNTSKSKTNPPYHFPNDILFPSSANSSDYFSSLHGSTNSFSLPSFNKLSSTSSSSSYLPIPFLTNSSYPSVTSLSKSTH